MQEKKDQKYIDLVSKVAHDVLPVSNARIASAIVIGNNVVGLGHNSYKTHPLQFLMKDSKNCVTRYVAKYILYVRLEHFNTHVHFEM